MRKTPMKWNKPMSDVTIASSRFSLTLEATSWEKLGFTRRGEFQGDGVGDVCVGFAPSIKSGSPIRLK